MEHDFDSVEQFVRNDLAGAARSYRDLGHGEGVSDSADALVRDVVEPSALSSVPQPTGEFSVWNDDSVGTVGTVSTSPSDRPGDQPSRASSDRQMQWHDEDGMPVPPMPDAVPQPVIEHDEEELIHERRDPAPVEDRPGGV